MIRSIARWLGFCSLAAAMGIGVLDGARSLSISGLQLTDVATAARWLAPAQSAVLEQLLAQNGVLGSLASLPAGPFFFCLGGACLLASNDYRHKQANAASSHIIC